MVLSVNSYIGLVVYTVSQKRVKFETYSSQL